jgi:hypothetical protein
MKYLVLFWDEDETGGWVVYTWTRNRRTATKQYRAAMQEYRTVRMVRTEVLEEIEQ